jgi:hypothetical protein
MEIIESLLIDELESKGYHFEDIDHLKEQNEPLPLEVIEIILKWLPKIYDEHLGAGDCLVRSLISAGEEFDPFILIDLFENSHHNKSIKWGIAYVLAVSKTYNITNWLKNQLFIEPPSFEGAGFIWGLVPKGGFKTKAELIEFLKAIFSKYAYYDSFLKLFQKYGSKEDIPFLEQEAALQTNKKTEKEILKVVDKIRNRKREAKFP